jgi:predicted aconitase with swiveling domain
MKEAGIDMKVLQSEVLLEGRAQGHVLRLSADISFWGGVDPESGRIIDRRHPNFGDSVVGKILAMRRSIGSSSGSSILLELFRRKRAPSGIILVEADMVVVLGVVVAREMGFASIPVVRISEREFLKLPETASIDLSGKIKSYKDSI